MMRTAAIFVGVAFWCCIGVPLARLASGDLQSSIQTVEESPDSCPVTMPSQPPFLPPAPYPSDGVFWIGSPKLWTDIPKSGTWQGLAMPFPGIGDCKTGKWPPRVDGAGLRSGNGRANVDPADITG